LTAAKAYADYPASESAVWSDVLINAMLVLYMYLKHVHGSQMRSTQLVELKEGNHVEL